MKHGFKKGLLGGLCLALALLGALPANAATSVFPNGARGSNANMDNDDGFYSTTRQLDMDFLSLLFDDFITTLIPTWTSGPVWNTITHQTSPSLYGADNNANGIVDTDHYDALAAIVNGGATAAPGLASGTITTIQNSFNTNRTRAQQRELTIQGVSLTLFITLTSTVTTGQSITVLGNQIDIPSLWSVNEDSAGGDNGVLAEAGDMFEVVMRDFITSEMTLCPGAGTNELNHTQSFINVFLRKFIATALPQILAGAGDITADNSNWNASPAPSVDMNVNTDAGNVRIRISSTNMNNAINNFSAQFNCTNFICQTGNGSLAAAGNLNGTGNTNAQSFAANSTNRQAFLAAEGITVPPLQFKPIPTGATGFQGGTVTIGDDEFAILGGDGSAKAYDWETINYAAPNYEFTYTSPALAGTTSNATYVYNPATAGDNGKIHSVQIADNTWTRTAPAFPLTLSGLPPAPTVSAVAVTGAQTIRVTFSSAVTTGATTAANYAVSGGGKGTLNTNPDLVTNLGSNQYQLTFNSPQEMLNGGNITVTVTGVQDGSGQNIGTPNSGSCTGCAIGTAPTIVSLVSQNPGPTNATSVNYLATFSEAVNTVNAINFTTSVVAGSVNTTIGTPTGSGSARTIPITGISGDGTFRLDLSTAAGIVDLAGNTLSNTLNGGNTIIDTLPPAAPTIDLASGSDSGASSTDDYTNDNTPTFNGVTSANATVSLSSSISGAIGTTAAGGGGSYSVTTSTLPDGVHTITPTATDSAGNSIAGTPIVVTIDTAAPAAPSTPDLLAAFDSGSSSTDNTTNLTTLDFEGTREANTSVTLTSSGTGSFTTTAVGSGTWTVTGSTLQANVTHQVRSRATDLAGNTSGLSAALPVVIDTAGPTVTVRNPASGATVGALASVQVTFNESVVGMAGANLTVNSSAATSATGSGVGPYTFSGYAAPADGTVNVAVVSGSATDAAGNAITPDAWTYTKNSSNPTITFVGTNITDGGITNGTPSPIQLTINFSEAVSGFAIGDITRTNCTLSSFTTLSASSYRVNVSPGPSQGNVSISVAANVATATALPAGRNNLASSAFTFTYDTVAPQVSFLLIQNSDPTNEDTITATVQFTAAVTDFDDQADMFVNTDGDVAYTSITIIPNSAVNYTVEFNGVTGNGSFVPFVAAGAARDLANNPNGIGPLSPQSITIDNTPPALTVNVLDTTDNRPPLSGTVGTTGVDEDTPVTVTVNGQSNGATVSGNTWTLADNTLFALPDGVYDVQLSATDIAGNTGTDSTTGELTVDANPPTITLTGGSFVSVDCGAGFDELTDGGYSATDAFDGNLTSEVIVTGAVGPLTPVGQHTITYTVTDAHGFSDTEVRTVEVLDNCPLDVTAVSATTIDRNGGEDVTFEIAVSGAIGPYTIQWYKVEGSKADEPIGDDDETLELTGLSRSDDADYYALVTDAVTSDFSPIFHVNVFISTPVAGAAGLGLMTALSALAGAMTLRRRKK